MQDCHISDKKMPKLPGENDYIPCHGQLVNLASGEKKNVVKARKKKWNLVARLLHDLLITFQKF